MLTQAKAATETLERASSPVSAGKGVLETWMSSRWLLTTMIVASCALHAAAAAAMLISRSSSEAQFGVLQKKVDTFSLSTSQSIVLESIATEPVEVMAAAAAAMPQGTVQSVDAEATLVEMEEPTPVAVEEPAPKEIKTAEVVAEAVETTEEPLEVIEGSAESVDAVKPEAVEEPAKEEMKVEEVKETEEKKKTKKEQSQSSQRQLAGGESARGESAVAAASGRVTASTGSILKYGARVRAKVARNKPPGRGRRGEAKVSFGLTVSGELTYVRLASSSGNPTLDEAAITAVQRSAPFGAPPTGASPDQLRFSIPFYFR